MDKILISIEDMAKLLHDSFEENCDCVDNEYCRVCTEMNDGCPNGDDYDKPCPHEKIVEYRYFVMQHFKPFMVKE